MRPNIRMLRSGAGHLDGAIANDLEALFEAPIIQTYGSTETSFVACDPLPPAVRKPGSVGLPGYSEVAVLSACGKSLPNGEEGEVVVRGDSIFDGYENATSTSASSIVDGWFRTGDQGYIDKDGYLFLTGRIKDLINRGGQKVSPLEIENRIA